MAISLLQLKMKLHPQSACWKTTGRRAPYSQFDGQAGLDQAASPPKCCEKMTCENCPVCLNTFVDGAEYFAGRGNRETLCYASRCWNRALKRIGKGDAQQTSRVSDAMFKAIIPKLHFFSRSRWQEINLTQKPSCGIEEPNFMRLDTLT